MNTQLVDASAQESFTDRCPWCDSPISRVKFLDVQRRIRTEEQKKMEAVRADLERRYRADADKRVAAVASRGEARIKEMASQRDDALRKAKALEVNRAGERKKLLEEVESRHKKEVSRLRQQLLGERTKIMEDLAESHRKELLRQREILAKEKDTEKIKVQSQFSRERETYQKKITELSRQLERKTANELGEGAEIDLFEALRDAFPDDRITRVAKGEAGADILHEVLHKGAVCGTIIIDSKNRRAWQNGYIAKLRSDQQEARAEHALLSTTVFPAGKKELCIEDGVVVVSPARAVHIVQILRQFLIRIHVLGLSVKERSSKATQLYKLITSEAYAHRFAEIGEIGAKIAELDVQELKDHQKVWQCRGRLTTRRKSVVSGLDAEIGAIVEARGAREDDSAGE